MEGVRPNSPDIVEERVGRELTRSWIFTEIVQRGSNRFAFSQFLTEDSAVPA